MRHQIRLNPFGDKPMIEPSNGWFKWWHGNMTQYMGLLLTKQKDITTTVLKVLNENAYYDRTFLVILGLVMCIIIVVFPLVVIAVHYMMVEMETTSDNLSVQTRYLIMEQRRKSNLVNAMLPKHISMKLKHNKKVGTEIFEEVTVFFSELVDFASISSRVSPNNVLVIKGLPHKNGRRHASEIASMALYIKNRITNMEVGFMRHSKLSLRIGVNSGKVVAGVVGRKMPRYCLFGYTIKLALLMKSRAGAGGIVVSQNTQDILQETERFITEKRDESVCYYVWQTDRIVCLCELDMKSYWLTGKAGEEMKHQDEDLNFSASTYSSESSNITFHSRRNEAIGGLSVRIFVADDVIAFDSGKHEANRGHDMTLLEVKKRCSREANTKLDDEKSSIRRF
ncbi:hypothetical protein LSH36_32g17007 [Paralvinella palmiformis]|uniref:Guanylate cyclase domain-containing protein n=1 Tax=Paralvinella palmiformis TaxID=53620 RepID=A0AAD9K9N7_9ANNE|nr:hypothetical protein LSH36_32g17007 [Paralvinella palmiformis]